MDVIFSYEDERGLKWFQMGFSSFCIDDLRLFEMGLREYRWPSHGQ